MDSNSNVNTSFVQLSTNKTRAHEIRIYQQQKQKYLVVATGALVD